MKTRERYPLEIDSGTTFRFGVRPFFHDEDGDRSYYTDTDIPKITFQVRSSEHGNRATYQFDYEDDRWTVVIPAQVTSTYTSHRAMYFVIDATFSSGDVKRLMEGPIRVRPQGGKVYR